MDPNEFNDIAPFNDEEASAALYRLSNHPNVSWVSRVLFPDRPETFLRDILRNIHSVDEFQDVVMCHAVEWVAANTMTEFTYGDVSQLEKMEGRQLFMSNHRDIILDPALMQIVLRRNQLPYTQIAVGDNLLKHKSVELLIRSNRMIKVIRGISARELYLSSQLLSRYIRETITSGTSSVWIAQRQGRTKDGQDVTEQGLLKMLDMSGGPDFVQNFMELNVVPLSISYEYEPCDILKAREMLISRTQKYVKGETEDLQSILTGIRQPKGRVHLEICSPLTEAEIQEAAACDKNDRYQKIRHTVDRRIISGYHLWKTNYMACDLLRGDGRYAAEYTPEELQAFQAYLEALMQKVEPELDRTALREILLNIYGKPVQARENLQIDN